MFVFINLSLFISRWLTLLPITTSNECIKPYLIFTLSSPSYCPNLLCIFPLSTVMTLLQISLTSLSFRVFFVGGGAGSGGILTCQNTTASEAPPTCTDSSSWTLMEKKIPQTCWMDSVHIYDHWSQIGAQHSRTMQLHFSAKWPFLLSGMTISRLLLKSSTTHPQPDSQHGDKIIETSQNDFIFLSSL